MHALKPLKQKHRMPLDCSSASLEVSMCLLYCHTALARHLLGGKLHRDTKPTFTWRSLESIINFPAVQD